MLPNLLLVAGFLLALLAHDTSRAGSLNQQQALQQKRAGMITGKARLVGQFKRPPPLKVYKNRDFCGEKVPSESLLFSSDGGLQNVVITLPGARQRTVRIQPSSLILDNKNCAFAPHVQVAPLGSELLLLNSDPILHAVHARLGSETLFNTGLPRWRQVTKRLTRSGIVTIDCDVLHTWMSAYIVVTADAFYTVTDHRGDFVIEGVPPGSYEMSIWHEKLGKQVRRIVVTEEDPLTKVDLAFPCFFC